MSSATNSHNYLCECWTRGVQSALADQFSDLQVSHRNRCKNRLHVVTSAQFPLFIFVLSVEAIYGHPCDLRHSELSQKLCREIAKIASRTASHSLAQSRVEASRLCFNVEAQRGFVETGVSVERLASGAVIADARCNLSISSLFTSLFSFFLNYLKCYLSNNEI